MKYLIVIATSVLFIWLRSLAGPPTTNSPEPSEWGMCWSNGLSHPLSVWEWRGGVKVQELEVMDTNTLPRLIKSGEVCKITGHAWRDGRPGEGGGFEFADYHPGISYRTCQICGKCESKSEGEWK